MPGLRAAALGRPGPTCRWVFESSTATGCLCSQPAQPGSGGELEHHVCEHSSAWAGCALQTRAAALLLLGFPHSPPSLPTAALLHPYFWHPTVKGRVWVWEPGPGASLAVAFLSCTPATWVPQQSQRAHRHWACSHTACDPGVSIWRCALQLPTLPAATAVSPGIGMPYRAGDSGV